MTAKPNKERLAKIEERRGKLQQRRGQGERKSAVSGSALGADSLISISQWDVTFDPYFQNLEVKALVSGNSGRVNDVTIDAWQTSDSSHLTDAHAFQLSPDVQTIFVSSSRDLDSNPGEVLSVISGVATTPTGDQLFSYYYYFDLSQSLDAKKVAGAR